MENYGLPGISRELLVSKAGLVGFKRILYYTKITNPKNEVYPEAFANKSWKSGGSSWKSSQGSGLYYENEVSVSC